MRISDWSSDVCSSDLHTSFRLESWNDVGNAADIISRYDISLDIGPTRHGITRGETIYFFDPSGNRNETFAGGYDSYHDNPRRSWGGEQSGKEILYYEKALNERLMHDQSRKGGGMGKR